MEVTLSKNSWHYALNRWSLEKDPASWSLCPYFWMTIWHIFSSPFRFVGRYFIFRPIEWIFVPRGERSWESREQRNNRMFGLGSGVASFAEKTENIIRRFLSVILLASFIGGFFGLLIFGVYKDGWHVLLEVLMLLGFSVGIAIFFGLLSWGFSKIGKTDTWSAIKGMFYAIKNKVCPAINWTDRQSNHVNN